MKVPQNLILTIMEDMSQSTSQIHYLDIKDTSQADYLDIKSTSQIESLEEVMDISLGLARLL